MGSRVCELALFSFIDPLPCAVAQQDDAAVTGLELGLAGDLAPLVQCKFPQPLAARAVFEVR